MTVPSPRPTHYERLQVAQQASPEVIRAAYRALASLHHPDRVGAQATDADAMAAINAAYAVLSDPVQRAAYDAALRHGAAPAQPAAPMGRREPRFVRRLRRAVLRHPMRWAAGGGTASVVALAVLLSVWWGHEQAQADQVVLRAWQAAAAREPAATASSAGALGAAAWGRTAEPVLTPPPAAEPITASMAEPPADPSFPTAVATAPTAGDAEPLPGLPDLDAEPTAAGPAQPQQPAQAAERPRTASAPAVATTAPVDLAFAMGATGAAAAASAQATPTAAKAAGKDAPKDTVKASAKAVAKAVAAAASTPASGSAKTARRAASLEPKDGGAAAGDDPARLQGLDPAQQGDRTADGDPARTPNNPKERGADRTQDRARHQAAGRGLDGGLDGRPGADPDAAGRPQPQADAAAAPPAAPDDAQAGSRQPPQPPTEPPAWLRPGSGSPTLDVTLRLRSALGLVLPR